MSSTLNAVAGNICEVCKRRNVGELPASKRAIRPIASPKIKEARMSPTMIVSILTEQDIRRSSVRACASHGITMGETEVAVKNKIMPRSPGIMKSADRCPPMVKERNRKTGNRTPKITTTPWSSRYVYPYGLWLENAEPAAIPSLYQASFSSFSVRTMKASSSEGASVFRDIIFRPLEDA